MGAGYQTWIADALRGYGLRVIEEPGWRTRGSAAFNPQGVVAHHDAIRSATPSAAIVKMMKEGRTGLAGPLCNVWLDDDADDTSLKGDPVAFIIAAGRANHAGAGSYRGLIGNNSVFGIEARNAGTGEAWSMAMLDAYYRVAAALCTGMNRGPEWICGHKEWAPTRKIDPKGIDMNNFRTSTGLHMLVHNKPPVPTVPPITPTPPSTPTGQESGMLRVVKNPHNPVELWLIDGFNRRYIGTPEEAGFYELQIAYSLPADTRAAGKVPQTISIAAFDALKG